MLGISKSTALARAMEAIKPTFKLAAPSPSRRTTVMLPSDENLGPTDNLPRPVPSAYRRASIKASSADPFEPTTSAVERPSPHTITLPAAENPDQVTCARRAPGWRHGVCSSSNLPEVGYGRVFVCRYQRYTLISPPNVSCRPREQMTTMSCNCPKK